MKWNRKIVTVIGLLSCALLGALIGELCKDSTKFSWLSFSRSFALENVTPDFSFFSFTFGFRIEMCVAQLLLMLVFFLGLYLSEKKK